tara:strand:- start:249 stop:479 length:231 start_codon:yes stop_codon:yes gene_type:complete
MNHLSLLRRHYSSKHKTWCYRQGYYQYDKLKKTSQYAPFICKFVDVPVATEEFAKKHGAKWDKNEKKWVIVREFKE